jgi:hypothetical protein
MAFPRDIFTLGLSGLSLNEILPLNPQQFEIAGSQERHLLEVRYLASCAGHCLLFL